jgi:16S rRNA (cytosine1402-N4)-methyltransferase
MAKADQHIPVLLDEVLEYLNPKPGDFIIDGTIGLGGHAKAILKRVQPGGKLLGIDRDRSNLEKAKQGFGKLQSKATLVCDSYSKIKDIAYASGFSKISGILLDLGFSSVHIEDKSRGFSFKVQGPLDMRYDQSEGMTAADIINGFDEEELARIFRQFGEERNARKIAKTIVKTRAIENIVTTTALAELIEAIIGRRGKIHPATRVFQALRIAVNDELGQLEAALPDMVEILKPGGRLAIISFHSLEDRIVKRFMKSHSGTEFNILTKKVIKPSQEEIRLNTRARSAKLRVAEKLL